MIEMKSRVLSRPGVNSLVHKYLLFSIPCVNQTPETPGIKNLSQEQETNRLSILLLVLQAVLKFLESAGQSFGLLISLGFQKTGPEVDGENSY